MLDLTARVAFKQKVLQMLETRTVAMRKLERSLRTKISCLDFEGCKILLINYFAAHGDACYPIFISICHERAMWKTIALKFAIDLEEEWNENQLKNAISKNQDNLFSVGYMEKTGIINGLTKVVVDRIFDQFIKLFFEFGYHIDATDFSGHTALHHAIKFKFSTTVKLLVEMGADLSIRAVVSSWVRVKLPAIYHALYALDEKVAGMLLMHCDESCMEMDLGKIDDNFVYLPQNIPSAVTKCLQEINQLTPLNFLLIILIIKSYGNPNVNSQILSELINTGKGVSALFHGHTINITIPESLLDFAAKTQASTRIAQPEVCKHRFVLQLIEILYNIPRYSIQDGTAV